MKNMNPAVNTGILLDSKNNSFLGSCFIFRYPDKVITAYHCIKSKKIEDITLIFPGSNPKKIYSVKSINAHPTADLAVLDVPNINENEITWPHCNIFDDKTLGLEITTFGYPQSYSGSQPIPTPRVFKGYIQRFLNHNSYLGFNYLAAELNFGCPGGLSGSPIFNSLHIGRLYGIITENFKSTTELDSVIEIDENGNSKKESYHNIINYGLALWLPEVEDWINNFVPPISAEEINRRSRNQQLWNETNSG